MILQRSVMLAALFAFAGLAPGAKADAMPKMSKTETLELFQAAGFPLQGKTVTNHCGKPANPEVSFTDLNGDGVPEAAFVDTGPCYPTGHWVSVMRRMAPGVWTPVFMSEGTVQPIAHRTNGWYDLELVTHGVSFTLQYTGRAYAVAETSQPAQPMAHAAAPTPRDRWRGAVHGGEVTVTIDAKPTPAQAAVVARALAKEIAESGGTGAGAGEYSVAEADLNGDGRPELLVMFDGSYWCGRLGCSNYILFGRPGGYKSRAVDTGVTFNGTVHLHPAMHHGMHDLSFDDSHHVFRWNGRQYH